MDKQSNKTIESYLSRHADGALSQDEKTFVENCLDANPDCRETFKTIQAVSSHLKETFSTMESSAAITERLSQFTCSLQQTHKSNKRSFRFSGSFAPMLWPRSFKYAGWVLAFVLLAILTTPLLILPHLESTTPAIGKTESMISSEQSTMKYKSGRAGDEIRRGTSTGKERFSAGYQFKAYEGAPVQFGQTLMELGDTVKGISQTDRQEKYYAGAEISLGKPFIPSIQTTIDPETETKQKIKRDARLDIEVEDTVMTMESIKVITARHQGTTAKASVHEQEEIPWAGLTLWIPAERLDAAIEDLKKLGKVILLEVQAEDVTEQYFDRDTRIKNMQRQEERLLKLYDKEDQKVEELLKVEQEIARVRTEIESLQGQQRLLDRQIAYSTIELMIRQKPKEEPIVDSEPTDVFTPLRRALYDALPVLLFSCAAITTLTGWIVSFAIFVLPWALLILLAWLLRRRFKRPPTE